MEIKELIYDGKTKQLYATNDPQQVVVHERIAQLVLLVADVEDRILRLGALLQTQTLCHGACHDIAHDHLQREDLDAAAELIALSLTTGRPGG